MNRFRQNPDLISILLIFFFKVYFFITKREKWKSCSNPIRAPCWTFDILQHKRFVLSRPRLSAANIWISLHTPLQFHRRSPLCNFNMPLNHLCGHIKRHQKERIKERRKREEEKRKKKYSVPRICLRRSTELLLGISFQCARLCLLAPWNHWEKQKRRDKTGEERRRGGRVACRKGNKSQLGG